MKYVLLFVLALIVAMVANWGGPRFYASQYGSRFQGSFAGRTFATGLVIFAGIIVGAIALGAVGERPSLSV
jgi:hypothetical protein